jgi:hypothetical protein
MEQKGSKSDEGPELEKPKPRPALPKKAAKPKAKLRALEPKKAPAPEPKKAHERKEAEPEFMKLTPTKNASIGACGKALDFVLGDSDIKNIGIIGPPGSGKSSVIETYEESSRTKFVHLGLAHFEDSQYADEGAIERKLACQLSRSMGSPSGLEAQREVSFAQSAMICASAFIVLVFGMHMAAFRGWVDFVASLESESFRDILSITTTNNSRFVSGIALLAALICILAFMLIREHEIAMAKARADMFKLEPSGRMNESFFDKRFSEVADEFERSKALNFVFEDLDSYNYIRIYERLREINLLINSRPRKTPVRFFYTARDGFFTESGKNKFFDFVIPVPPSQAAAKVFDELGKTYEDLDKELLKMASAHMDDCRAAKSAANEFAMMAQRDGIDLNKAMAAVLYKSAFPEDYRDLVSGNGILRAIFSGGVKAINELEQNNRLFLRNEIAVYEKMRSVLGEYSGRPKEDCVNALRENNDVYQAYKGLVEEMIYNGHRESLDLTSTIMYLGSKINYMKNQALAPKRLDIKEILQYESLEGLLSEEGYESVKGSKRLKLLEFLLKHGHMDESFYGYLMVK